MADNGKTVDQGQTGAGGAQHDKRGAQGGEEPALQDWEIDHGTGKRKAHPGQGDHFVGNAAETVQAPITNEPADQTRSHGNRPKNQMGPSDHD